MEYTKRICLLRETKKKSLEEASKGTGIDIEHFADIESGKAEPTIDEVVEIAKYYDVCLDFIIGRTNVPIPFDATAEETAVYKSLENMSKEELQKVRDEVEKSLQK